MDSLPPPSPRRSLQSGEAASDPQSPINKSKRVKLGNAKPPAFSLTASSALPEEIMLAIFSNIRPPSGSDDHFNYPRSNQIWSPPEINNVALTCRRFYKLVLPALSDAFEGWCHFVSRSVRREKYLGWSTCLRAILRQPRLGTYLTRLEVNTRPTWCWEMSEPMLERRDYLKWRREDFQLADAAVDELCERDIWRGFPGGLPAGRMQRSENLTSEEVSQEWSACIRAGRSDAILALLITLASNLESLALSGFNASLDEWGEEEVNNWHNFRIDNDSDFVQRIFRGATNSQMATLGNKSAAEGEHKNMLLPSLRSIKIESQRDDCPIEIREVLSYLTLPSLVSASLSFLDDDSAINEDIIGVKLFLKRLEVGYQCHGIYSTGRLFACCPNLSHLSYTSTDNGHEEAAGYWIQPPPLVAHLAAIAPQLKSFTLADTDFVDIESGSENLSLFEICAFKQLRELDTLWEHLENIVGDGSGALWRLLPRGLEKLTVRDVGTDGFDGLAKEVRRLVEVKGEGLVPNLKEVVIVSRRPDDRDLPEDQKLFDDAMEEACLAFRDAPINVRAMLYE